MVQQHHKMSINLNQHLFNLASPQHCVRAGEMSACTYYHSDIEETNTLACLYLANDNRLGVAKPRIQQWCPCKIVLRGTCFDERFACRKVSPSIKMAKSLQKGISQICQVVSYRFVGQTELGVNGAKRNVSQMEELTEPTVIMNLQWSHGNCSICVIHHR